MKKVAKGLKISVELFDEKKLYKQLSIDKPKIDNPYIRFKPSFRKFEYDVLKQQEKKSKTEKKALIQKRLYQNNDYMYLRKYVTEDVKTTLWSRWSENKGANFPSNLEEMAYDININAGLDINHSYGFTILNQSIMNNWSINKTKTYFSIDDFGYQVIYVKTIKS